MKIIEQKPKEFNPEVNITLNLQQLKTLLAITGCTTDDDAVKVITKCTSSHGDAIKYEERIYPIYNTLYNTYDAVPKVPRFQPVVFEIESKEELAALRIGMGKLTQTQVQESIEALGINCELGNVMSAASGVFHQLDEIISCTMRK